MLAGEGKKRRQEKAGDNGNINEVEKRDIFRKNKSKRIIIDKWITTDRIAAPISSKCVKAHS